MDCFLLKDVVTNISNEKLEKAISLVELFLQTKEQEDLKMAKHGPFQKLWDADMKHYLSQGLAVTGLKLAADFKEALSMNDKKNMKAEILKL